jgi:SAM-dependent methyltransferase
MTDDHQMSSEKKEDYYLAQFLEYHEQTFHINPTSFLEPLAKNLKPGAHVLDVGCGSGRDLLWFKNLGFIVTGLERSAELARLARQNVGCEVVEGDFKTFYFPGFQVDAVTLIGALVHVPHDQLASVLALIIQSLRADGYVLITLKEGNGIKTSPEGRVFYLWDHSALTDIFAGLGLISVDFSRQVSKIRPDDVWLGYVLQKIL